MLRRLFGVSVEGFEHLPRDGAVILAPNHASAWDPVFLFGIAGRPMYFMAKEELFRNQLLARLLYAVHAFPVRRGTADKKALRRSLIVLEQRQVLCVFPEGTRNRGKDPLSAHHGIAMLCLRAQAPVLPVACIGTRERLVTWWKKPVRIRFGEPVHYEEAFGEKVNAQILEAISEDLMTRISNLLSA